VFEFLADRISDATEGGLIPSRVAGTQLGGHGQRREGDHQSAAIEFAAGRTRPL
jgi:hypothetical protein